MLNIGYRKNLHFRHFKSRKFCAKLSFFRWKFDNFTENIVNFYNQIEFWKKVKYVSKNSIFCNTCRPFSIIKDRRCEKFWTHFCLHCLWAKSLRSTYTLVKMQFKNCMRVAIIFCNLVMCWKQAKTKINKLSETIYCYFDLKVNTCNCRNLDWFCFKFLHLLV